MDNLSDDRDVERSSVGCFSTVHVTEEYVIVGKKHYHLVPPTHLQHQSGVERLASEPQQADTSDVVDPEKNAASERCILRCDVVVRPHVRNSCEGVNERVLVNGLTGYTSLGCSKETANEEREVLNSVLVSALDTANTVKLLLGDFASLYGFPCLLDILTGSYIIVDA